ncbi:MAG: low molecular weight phosphotyrosine protein phosphatase [Aliifodinibius sp.]|nr:low molecular weight phosphotyrosine protein phosphatase [candidate division KSB1 bacterium]NIT57884.1 low molecular weight phosphotyrosine protein phosphatase [Fodinibius sp.]NIV12748.1 low molecular weight phosphotyrosine protein phosphatase [Fodinibius sp.]NIY26466.1 low molecular weight phosphotyrosine protein phosphatase [Fodinibius sp.]
MTRENHYKICFVCLGNICRSPTAEGIFQHLINERNLENHFEIDSAGTSAYHVGESANSKSQRTAQKHGITLHSKARQFETSDLDYYDLILAMDNENLNNVRQMAHDDHEDKLGLMRDFDPNPGDGEVPDPYYGGPEGFENVFQIVKRSCENLLDELETHVKK